MAELHWVKAGKKLDPGQIAIMEDDPDHPWNEAAGAHQAVIVKDDPKFDTGQVAMTPRVAEALRLRFLVETKAPKGAADAGDDAAEEAAGEGEQAPARSRRTAVATSGNSAG